MSDNQLPKATMANYIRDRVRDKKKVSAEFTTVMLDLSKEFIDRVAAKANEICEQEGKKTINNEHLYKSLRELGMEGFQQQLERLDNSIKEKEQKKKEVKKQVQEKIDQMNKEHDARQGTEGNVPTSILLEKGAGNKAIVIEDEEEDFCKYLDEEEGEEKEEEEGEEKEEEEAQ